jgi:hypothetical protein
VCRCSRITLAVAISLSGTRDSSAQCPSRSVHDCTAPTLRVNSCALDTSDAGCLASLHHPSQTARRDEIPNHAACSAECRFDSRSCTTHHHACRPRAATHSGCNDSLSCSLRAAPAIALLANDRLACFLRAPPTIAILAGDRMACSRRAAPAFELLADDRLACALHAVLAIALLADDRLTCSLRASPTIAPLLASDSKCRWLAPSIRTRRRAFLTTIVRPNAATIAFAVATSARNAASSFAQSEARELVLQSRRDRRSEPDRSIGLELPSACHATTDSR